MKGTNTLPKTSKQLAPWKIGPWKPYNGREAGSFAPLTTIFQGRAASCSGDKGCIDGSYTSGQIITTSAEVTLNGGLIRELPQNPLNSGLGIILICPDTFQIFAVNGVPKFHEVLPQRSEWYCQWRAIGDSLSYTPGSTNIAGWKMLPD